MVFIVLNRVADTFWFAGAGGREGIHSFREIRDQDVALSAPIAGRAPMQHRSFQSAVDPGETVEEKPVRTFRHVLIRVMAMQLVTLAVLAFLQFRYGR